MLIGGTRSSDKNKGSRVAGNRTLLPGSVQTWLNHWGEDPYWNRVGNTYALLRSEMCN